jgi:hypothetical protein
MYEEERFDKYTIETKQAFRSIHKHKQAWFDRNEDKCCEKHTNKMGECGGSMLKTMRNKEAYKEKQKKHAGAYKNLNKRGLYNRSVLKSTYQKQNDRIETKQQNRNKTTEQKQNNRIETKQAFWDIQKHKQAWSI